MISQIDHPIAHSPNHIGHFVSYNNLSGPHRHLVLNISPQFEPQYFHQAVQFPQWHEAMKLDLELWNLITHGPLFLNLLGNIPWDVNGYKRININQMDPLIGIKRALLQKATHNKKGWITLL